MLLQNISIKFNEGYFTSNVAFFVPNISSQFKEIIKVGLHSVQLFIDKSYNCLCPQNVQRMKDMFICKKMGNLKNISMP